LLEKLPIELDDILDQWKKVYDNVDEYLNSNMSNLKSNIEEFGSLSTFYYTTYINNITYDYVDSLIEQKKNDLNYTIKFYYNKILSKVNKTYSYILNNIPINIEPFDEILKIRESEIKNSYNNILNKIQASKFKVLLMNNQLSILKVSQTNFFSINFISNDNVNKIEEKLLPKSLTISETSQKISKVEKEELIIARFYLENSINGNQTKNIYESIDKATFIDLQDNVFKTIVDETYEIEQDQLIKNIITSLNEMNEKINQGYKYEKDQYEEIIRKKIYQEFFTKDKLEEKINSFYKMD
jgi:hypothetical protein